MKNTCGQFQQSSIGIYGGELARNLSANNALSNVPAQLKSLKSYESLISRVAKPTFIMKKPHTLYHTPL